MKKDKQFEENFQKIATNNFVIIGLCIIITLLIFAFWNYIVATISNAMDTITKLLKTNKNIVWSLPSLKYCFVINKDIYFLYFLIGIFTIVVNIKLVYKIKTSFTTLNQGQKGERAFSTVAEIKKQYKCIPEKQRTYKGGGGALISRYKDKIFIDDSPVNNLIIGTTRSGKGETYVVPSIDIYSRAEYKPSMVVNDPKGELAGASASVLKDRGYDVHILDLVDFMGLSYNPLEIIKDAYMRGDKEEAQMLTRTFSFILFNDPLAKDKTWQNWSISLTNALIMAHVIDCVEANEPEKINMYSVTNLLISLGQKQIDEKTNQLDKFFIERPSDDIARLQYSSIAFAQGKQKGNIFSNTLAKLELFTYDNIAKMTSKNNINLLDIGYGNTPQAIFMIVPDYDCSNHFLATLFISQLYFVSAKRAAKSKDNKCIREIVFMLDEFGNMPAIPDMSNIITVCLGRNMRFNLIVQAYSQIEGKYGKDDSKTIIGNCGNHIYLLTNEYETAAHFSKLIGNETITVKNRSGDGVLDLDKKITEHVDTKPLLNASDLMEFIPGESAVVRVMKRQDLKRRKVKPKPIFNTEETILKFRYEYLPEFDTSNTLESLNLIDNCEHKDILLSSVIYSPFIGAETDYEFIETDEIPDEPMLSDMVKSDVLYNLVEIIGIENDYGNMSVDEFFSFLTEAYSLNKISEEIFYRAKEYINKLLITAESS